MKFMKVTGGFRGYQAAASEGFMAHMYNPTIIWNVSKGFFVESGLSPVESGDIVIGECYYNLNDNGRKSQGSYKNYIKAKAIIIGVIQGEDERDKYEKYNEIGYWENN